MTERHFARQLSVLFAAGLLGCGARASTERSTTLPVDTRVSAFEAPVAPSVVMLDSNTPQLDARVEVPGTGVSMRAPHGCERTPIGAGFIDPGGELQLFVSVASGEQTLDALADFGADASEVLREDVPVDGRVARMVIDTQTEDGLEIERVWLLVLDDGRALAVLGEYPASASDRLRAQVRASLLSTEWDSSATIEPERAAGYRLTAPAGLEAEPEVVNGLTYVTRGTEVSPESGRPAIMVFPLGIDVPASERARYCEEILLVTGPIGEEAVVARTEIATPTLEGCELFGLEEVLEPIDGGPTTLATYAAIVFLDEEPLMVAAFVDANEREVWAPQFSAAARTVTRAAQ